MRSQSCLQYCTCGSFRLQAGVTAIATGTDHNCVIMSAGSVKCWGNNSCGELGDGTASVSYTPVDVVGLTDRAIAITVGLQHTYVLTSSGAVKCWGAPLGLGNGSDNCSFTPVDVTGLASNVVAVSAKSSHTCALTSSGGIKCWGFNVDGQLGNGDHTGPELCSTFPCSKTPVSVIGFGG